MKKKNETATTAGNWGEWEEYLVDELIATLKEINDECKCSPTDALERRKNLFLELIHVMLCNPPEPDLKQRIESEVYEILTDYEGAEPEIYMQRLQLLNNLRNYIAKLLA